ncbi:MULTISPECIES: HlyD family secretion protein [Halomonadaceae]|uniref:HlyD family secretion protein n=1 Tax=Halomonadaceae TaxID=28256 RepID=UPI00089F3EB9|nr:HlyD family secretion protein [Halomonas sp. A11-A]SEF62814.1 HlyD family secretion protein [Halomonas desiderata]
MSLNATLKKWGTGALILGLGAVFVLFLWRYFNDEALEGRITSGNGRIEATEIDIATKAPGRVADILIQEGDFVSTGQVLARMDIEILQAQLREAEAGLARARIGVQTAHSLVAQREAELEAATAFIAQREAERRGAQARFVRTENLAARDAISQQTLDDDRARLEGARAAVAAARAQRAGAEAALGTARAQVISAETEVAAVSATIERIAADIADSELKAPRDGRVQYLVAQPGEVLPAGGVVLNMVDLSDVYMTFFLPTEQAGRVALGAEARLVLDAVPQYVIPAQVSFVADVAQFTPRTVETAEERQKLMFRIKVRIDPELLKQHLHQVKTGLPGMAYVRLDPQIDWPPELQARLPQ